jgi:DNA transformation protein
VGPVRVRKMFGGAGVCAGERMFALIAQGLVYLKVNDALKADLAGVGSQPFVWIPPSGPRQGQKVEMSYWRLPDEALDDPEIAAKWARRASAVANAAPPAKKKIAKANTSARKKPTRR